MFCPSCGNELSDQAYLCPKCGVKLKANKNMLVALLLCFFLGLLGFHRFYMGHVGSGIVQCLLTITVFGSAISLIWAIIDFVMIICGKFKTKDGMPLE